MVMPAGPRPHLWQKRFDKFYIPEPNSGCWLWTGALSDGYGDFGLTGSKTTGAHRISWILHRGPIPDGLFVLHTCDNKACVNPDHLYVGTHADNMRDATERTTKRRRTKLNLEKAAEIRASSRTCRDLAAIYGVHNSIISEIRTGKRWNPDAKVASR